MKGTARLTGMLRSIGLLRFMSKIWMPIADEVVIIGGGLVGLELAEYLVERGRKVSILEPGPALGPELAIVRRARVLHILREHDVEILKEAPVVRIEADRVVFNHGGEQKSRPCKQVIIAIGAEADAAMADQLAAGGAEVHRIGDCRDKRFIDGAILDAREVVKTIG